MFKVEHNFASGWADAEWNTDGVPDRFPTKEAADAAIDEFIKEQKEAFEEGFMEDEYPRDDFRAVPAD